MNTFDTHIRNATIVTLLCAFAAVQAWAAPEKPDFKAYDNNSDGMISLEEFVALGGQGQAFLEGDLNSDDHLSSDELINVTASKEPQTRYR
jgi:N-acetylneuraminic acid mutarotase